MKQKQPWMQKHEHTIPSLVELQDMVWECRSSRNWYFESREVIRQAFGTDMYLFARILAATSPMRSVRDNLVEAYRVYNFVRPLVDMYQHDESLSKFQAHNLNLLRICKGEELQGRKVKSFYLALIGDENAVTIDRWIMRVFNLDRNPTKADYDNIEYIIRLLSENTFDRFGRKFSPAECQACLWSYARKQAGKVELFSFKEYLIEKAHL